MKSILIAPNSFKECADSNKISDLLENSLKKYLSLSNKLSYKIIKKPISDGGDGFLEICKNIYDLEKILFAVPTPFENDKITVAVGYSSKLKTIFIESAIILGLKVVPQEKRVPAKLSSIGLGSLLFQINEQIRLNKLNVNKVLIGIGGTATNDLGMGCAGVFGLKLFDNNGTIQNILPENYINTKKVKLSEIDLNFEIELILDVNNPLVGENGATNIFGRQKGLNESEIQNIEAGINNILTLLKLSDEEINELKGAGGGLAAGLQIFFNSTVKTAQDFILNEIGIQSDEFSYDLIITGEGNFDMQSFNQKGPMVVISEFENSNIPIIVVCGDSEVEASKIKNLTIYRLRDYYNSKRESIKNYKNGLDFVSEKIVKDFLI